MRLRRGWEGDFEDWSQRDLTGNRYVYVYVWAGGIPFNIKLEGHRQCILLVNRD